MTTKHTPGPWKLTCASRAVTSPSGWDIARMPVHTGPITIDDMTANARLIAAAPELLAALQKLTDQADWVDLNVLSKDLRGYRLIHEIVAARAAISKATGGQS